MASGDTYRSLTQRPATIIILFLDSNHPKSIAFRVIFAPLKCKNPYIQLLGAVPPDPCFRDLPGLALQIQHAGARGEGGWENRKLKASYTINYGV